ncbi:intermembrane phospholipid transport protein YdbH family protein [Photobacterium leiognathi]|uniref:intermembrane phospholipid transport protein YdbH family protein n=1 Tax=Photobacterium leiognathi TaxID=553611 RepID=UPI0029817E69|nr:YdbH domain-containing protein [Photobacterium leiognathi]
MSDKKEQQNIDIEPNSSNTDEQLEVVPQNKRFRRFLFWSILIFVVTPPVILSSWLSTKGIHLNNVSGLTFNNGIAAKKISVSIDNTTIDLENLSLRRNKNKETGDVSYHLFAVKSSVQLPKAATKALADQNIKLNYIHFYDADLKFTHFSTPFRFTAHARKVTSSALHTNSVTGWPNAVQILEDVNVNFDSDPHISLTGNMAKGVITLFFPDYNPSPHYRLPFNDGSFSISWQGDATPFKINIGTMEPQWETLYSILEKQIITNAGFSIDFKHPTESMVLTANKLHLEEPKFLPKFVERADINNKGYHLGQTIANLAQLPMHKFRVKSFTYGDLILDARVLLETPTADNKKATKKTKKKKKKKKVQTQQDLDKKEAELKAKQQAEELNIAEETHTKAKFIVRGKALAPDPYNLDVTVRHLTKTDARVHTSLVRNDGNRLDCDTVILFAQPLPKYMNCNAKFKGTKEFTDRLGLKGLPDAKINGPLRFVAIQTEAPVDAPKDKRMLVDNKLATAYYDVGFELPESFAISLNKYAIPAGLFKKKAEKTSNKLKEKQLADVQMITDGRIDFNVNFYDKLLRVILRDKKEKISFVNKRTQSSINFDFNDLNCLYPDLQCHINAEVEAQAKTIYPMPESQINDFTFKTHMVATWANHLLIAQMTNNNISMDQVNVKGIPGLQKSLSKDIHFHLDSLIGLYTQDKFKTVGNFTIYQPADTKASLTSEFIVNRNEDFNNNDHDSLSRYRADLGIKVNNFYLSQEIKLIKPLPPVKAKPVVVKEKTTTDSIDTLLIKKLVELTGLSHLKDLSPQIDFTAPYKVGADIAAIQAKIRAAHQALYESVTVKPLQLKSDYDITFSAQRNNQKLGKIYSQGHAQLNGSELNINSKFKNSNHALFADMRLLSNFDTGVSNIKLKRHTFTFTPEQDLKSFYIPVLPIDLNITQGQLTTSADITVNKDKQISGFIDLSTHRITGEYESFRFGNVGSHIHLALSSTGVKTQSPLEISADYLDVGVPMSNPRLLAEFDTSNDYYHIAHGTTELYGGNITIEPITITSLSNIKQVPVTVSGVDLARVIAEADQDNIELTGRIDGVIPIALEDGSIVIRNAKLQTQKPGGVLRYIQGSTIDKKVKEAGTYSPLNIVEVLGNYHYNSIALAFDYAKNGDLSLKTRIEGKNPDFQHGRPINVNIKLNDNIPKLLRSKELIDSSPIVAQIKQQLGVQ